MFVAELRKRAVSSAGDAAASEDLITGAVLCLLDYLPEDVAAAAVERLLGLPRFVAPVEFWPIHVARIAGGPSTEGTEPDAVLLGDGWVALVEAKHNADFAPGQLEREFDVLLKLAEQHGVRRAQLVLLTTSSPYPVSTTWWERREVPLRRLPDALLAKCPMPAPSHWERAMNGKLAIGTTWLHWEDVVDALTDAAARLSIDTPTRRLLTHVDEFVRSHALRRPRARGIERFLKHPVLDVVSFRRRASSTPRSRLARHAVIPSAGMPVRYRRP